MRALWTNFKLFWQGAYFSYVALFHWLEPPVYIASKLLMPLGQMIFFTLLGVYGGRGDAAYFVIGNAMQIVAINGIYGVTMSIGGERWSGTLQYLFGSPANRLVIFSGRAMMHIIDGMLSVVVGLLCGVLLFGVDLSRANVLGLALIIIVTAISTSGLGLLLGCISLVSLNVWFFNNIVYFLLLVFCGVNVPLNVIPGWMQTIGWSLPLTRGIEAARQVVAGASLDSVFPLIVGELLIGVLYVGLGYSFFRWFEFKARHRGTLEAV